MAHEGEITASYCIEHQQDTPLYSSTHIATQNSACIWKAKQRAAVNLHAVSYCIKYQAMTTPSKVKQAGIQTYFLFGQGQHDTSSIIHLTNKDQYRVVIAIICSVFGHQNSV